MHYYCLNAKIKIIFLIVISLENKFCSGDVGKHSFLFGNKITLLVCLGCYLNYMLIQTTRGTERGSAHDFTSSSILTWHNSAGRGIVQGTIELLSPSF